MELGEPEKKKKLEHAMTITRRLMDNLFQSGAPHIRIISQFGMIVLVVWSANENMMVVLLLPRLVLIY